MKEMAWARATLASLDVTGGDASLKREVALVPARFGAALWGSTFLGREPAAEVFGNTIRFEPCKPDDLMWNDAYRFAQIAHASAEIEVLTAPLEHVPIPQNYDIFFRYVREGLSAQIRGEGQQAADGYIAAIKSFDIKNLDLLYMAPNSLLDLQVPALELWDAIFRQVPKTLKDKLVQACDLHRSYYRRERMLNNPDSFISRSAWAARSWAHRLGWDFDIDHPALPAVLPFEADAG